MRVNCAAVVISETLRNGRIGFVFQLHHLLPQLTVIENVLVPLELRGEIGRQERTVVISTANGLKFTDFKVQYHEGTLKDVPHPRHANQPHLLPNAYPQIRDTVRRLLDEPAVAR